MRIGVRQSHIPNQQTSSTPIIQPKVINSTKMSSTIHLTKSPRKATRYVQMELIRAIATPQLATLAHAFHVEHKLWVRMIERLWYYCWHHPIKESNQMTFNEVISTSYIVWSSFNESRVSSFSISQSVINLHRVVSSIQRCKFDEAEFHGCANALWDKTDAWHWKKGHRSHEPRKKH